MAEKTIYPRLNDEATTWNNIFQQQDASITKKKEKRILNNKLTDAEKRKSRTYRKRA